jgi:hypothetical protein
VRLTAAFARIAQPDPAGARLAVLKCALAQLDYLEGVFFDCASLHQVPRTHEEDAIFKSALPAMNQLYASAVGTTVLQIKEIPPRPAEMDGWLCLFGVAWTVDMASVESAVGSTLRRFGEVVAVVDRRLPPLEREEIAVRFASHDAVLEAVKAAPASDVWTGLGALYTDRPYDHRGWYASPKSCQRSHSTDHPRLTTHCQVLLGRQHQLRAHRTAGRLPEDGGGAARAAAQDVCSQQRRIGQADRDAARRLRGARQVCSEAH